ncbi:MAG: Flagellar basal-body rod protein FlgG [Smithella sp. PtaU1.Bin162]|nr:MAG: Flagellar basal-body rod protein FlgG [Smithella sp. PtaU1.Bin162]
MNFHITDIAHAGDRVVTRLDLAANNLANVSTPGFKSEHLFYATAAINDQEKDKRNTVNTLNFQETKRIDFSQGQLGKTGNKLDMAIEGEGFFTIQQKEGISYTRNGSFAVNKNNELVTKKGLAVLGESGPIKVSGTSVEVASDGTVIVDGVNSGKLKITDFKEPDKLVRVNESQYIDKGNAGAMKAEKYRVENGCLESSNASAVKEMVDMMDIHRTFETYQKIILTLTDLDKISVSRIGKLI